ncbi:hypothetical protein EDB85DRAFT_2087584 [Lactarius pseudohatsudake]|nr:hypothetical protein EDB85DRAFT_2087584 [Lactarius pseudohatsudake]
MGWCDATRLNGPTSSFQSVDGFLSNASLTRVSLYSSKHSSVDAFLKSLKMHMRKLSALLAQRVTVLVLRIYYINNNQHCAALFWKRVVEARRYSPRLKSFDMSSFVNDLRRSFYSDEPDAREPGCTTHSHPLSICFLDVCTCIALLDKTSVCMCVIYRMLTLAEVVPSCTSWSLLPRLRSIVMTVNKIKV